MEKRLGTEEDGRKYVAWEVGGWSVYAGEEVPGGATGWQVVLLPEGDLGHLKRLLDHVSADEAQAAAATVAAALDHVFTETARTATGQQDMT